MNSDETIGPDTATRERLMANTQRLLYNMVNRKRQKEGEPPPTEFCITGSDVGRGEGGSADEAKNVGAEREMEGQATTTKYKVPEVIQMGMSISPSLEKFKSSDVSEVGTETSKRGLKRAFDGEIKGGPAIKRRTGGEVKEGSEHKRTKVSKSREGFAVLRKSGMRVAKELWSVGGDSEVGIRTGKQPPGSITAGIVKKQPKVLVNLGSSKEGQVKGVGPSKHVGDGKKKAGRPRSKHFPPTKQILGETPQGDQTWVDPPTFYPTLEEMANLVKYIEFMESQGAHKAGIAKIVPPKEWVPRRSGYNPADLDHIVIKPVQQNIAVGSMEGAFKTIANRSRPPIDVKGYRRLATSKEYLTPAHSSYEELEELYWKENLDDKGMPPIYGADVSSSLTDEDQTIWNIKHLDSMLAELMEERIPGVNLPYLYFGMWKATFSWHIEDMDLYSVNYLHNGAPKTWYCIPPQFGYKLEQVAQKLFPDFTLACFNLLRHKAIMIGPKILEANGVRVQKVVHEAGSMIVVFPHAYHSGFNHGFNMAESANFAANRWVEYGKRFRDCVCLDQDKDISINMAPFVKAVQPERYKAYLEGRDFALHPEDPWYVRRCMEDATMRLKRKEISDEEFEEVKQELRRKRQIPHWFKKRFKLDYDDQLPELRPVLTCEEVAEEMKNFPPRVWQAKRLLEERLEEGEIICDVQIRKLHSIVAETCKQDLDSYNQEKKREQYEHVIMQMEIKTKEMLGGPGKQAGKGVGFKEVDDKVMLEKKARMVCKAEKTHKFVSCKRCAGCRTENCGKCHYCLDMTKFGGPNKLKQKCVKRVCVNPLLNNCRHCVWNV